jgi:hypothetical protein
MAKISFSKESLEGKPQPPEGLYELRLEGFEPKMASKKTSVNLSPVLKIVNHQTHTGYQIYDNLNTGAGWIIEAFCHAMGQPLVQKPDGSFDIPGEFVGPDDKPEDWNYVGPLSGCVAKAMLKPSEYNGKTNMKVDQWFCAVPGCNSKHPSGLAK